MLEMIGKKIFTILRYFFLSKPMCFNEFMHGISTVRAKLQFFVHYLYFGTGKIFIGQVHYSHLLVSISSYICYGSH